MAGPSKAIKLLLFLNFVFSCAQQWRTIDGYTHGHGDCPPNTKDTWVPHGRGCTTTVLEGSWSPDASWSICSTPSWRFGPGAQLAVLYDRQHALNVAQTLLTASRDAWVALSTVGPGAGWQWPGNVSQYALNDADAWSGGIIPTPSRDKCAYLTVDGTLKSDWCDITYVPRRRALCSLPACTCSSPGSCGTMFRLPSAGGGYACWNISAKAPPRITSLALPDSWTADPGPIAEEDDRLVQPGCGNGTFASTAELEACLRSSMYLHSQNALLAFGNFSSAATVDTELHLRTIRPRDLRHWSDECGPTPAYAETDCKAVRMGYYDGLQFTKSVTRSIAVGTNFTCAILYKPHGLVQCWGGTVLGRPKVAFPYTDGPVVSVVACLNLFCIITAEDRKILCFSFMDMKPQYEDELAQYINVADAYTNGFTVCWLTDGDLFPSCLGPAKSVVNFQKPVSMFALGLGVAHACGMHLQNRLIECKTDQSLWFDYNKRKTATPQSRAATVVAGGTFSCMVEQRTARVRCWGSESPNCTIAVPDDLPPVRALVPGHGHVCAILAVNNSVFCWGQCDGDSPQHPPSDLPPVDELAVGRKHACATLMDGQVRCWGSAPTAVTDVPAAVNLVNVINTADSLPIVLSYDGAAWGGRVVPTYAQRNAMLFITTYGRESLDDDGGIAEKPELEIAWSSGVPGPIIGTHALLAGAPYDLLDPVLFAVVQTAPETSRAEIILPMMACVTQSLDTTLCNRYSSGSEFIYGIYFRQWKVDAWVEEYAGKNLNYDVALYRPRIDSMAAMELGSLSLRDNVTVVFPCSDCMSEIDVFGKDTISVSVPSVRPRDMITLRGSGFGLHAKHQEDVAKWWKPQPGQLLRSCIRLSWWVVPARIDFDLDCACNGLEDWLGEGELPLSAITAWNDTYIAFAVPPAAGVREVSVCVEGKAMGKGVRTSSAFYLAWQPPALVDIAQGRVSTSTDADSAIDLVLEEPMIGPLTTACNITVDYFDKLSERYMLQQPVPASFATFEASRLCTSITTVRSAVGGACASMASNATFLGAAGAELQHSCPPVLTSQPAQPAQDVWYPFRATVAWVEPMPKAILSETFTLQVWDSGVLLRAPAPASSVTFSRIQPALRSVAPNPLLLGPGSSRPSGGGDGDADTEAPVVLLTLYGVGLRTAEEITDPRHGLLDYDPSVTVFVDDKECRNAVVVRPPASFAFVTCEYPQALLGGGVHDVSLTSLNVTTALRADGTNAVLRTECAPGYYGLFGVPGHQTCRPCPVGAACAGGIGRPPVALPGFWNLGLPVAASGSNGTLEMQESSIDEALLSRKVCSDGRAAMACVLPCEPTEACTGSNGCALGYESAPPSFRCAQCSPGYYRSLGVCVLCPSTSAGTIVIGLSALLLLAAFVYLLSRNAIKLQAVTTVLEYAQLLSLLHGPTIPWPKSVGDTLESLSVFRLNLEAFAPECYSSIGLSPEARLLVLLVLPVLLCTCTLTLYISIALLKSACTSSSRLSCCRNWRARLIQRKQLWSHGPPLSRLTLKLLGVMYLPVVKACIEAFNCLPTNPPDGKEYLTIAFEECGVPNGLQARMIPYSILGLVAYGAMYPLGIALFFWSYSELIVEDQILRAAGVVKTKKVALRTSRLRAYAGPLYVDYKPGHHYAAFGPVVRGAIVLVCYLTLNRSAVFQAAAVGAIMSLSMVLGGVFQPLMTPGHGFNLVLQRWAAHFRAQKRDERHPALHAHLCKVAADLDNDTLRRVCDGVYTAASDGQGQAQDGRAVFTEFLFLLDWNILELELQMQVLLAALLSIMYNAARESIYAEKTTPAVTIAFFMLLCIASAHIVLAVGQDFFKQVTAAVYAKLELEALEQSLQACEGSSDRAAQQVLTPGTLLSYAWRAWRHGKVAAREMAVERHKRQAAASIKLSDPVPEWTANPIQSPVTTQPSMNVKVSHPVVPASSSTLDGARARMGGPSMELTALRRRHADVRVSPDELGALAGPPSSLDDWSLLVASYRALWEAVGSERQAAKSDRSEAERVRQELETVRQELERVRSEKEELKRLLVPVSSGLL